MNNSTKLMTLGICLGLSNPSYTKEEICSIEKGMKYDYNQDIYAPEQNRKMLEEIEEDLCPLGCGKVLLFENSTATIAFASYSGLGYTKIIYNPESIECITSNFGEDAMYGILAHEFGHQINLNLSNYIWAGSNWMEELDADWTAGCALAIAHKDPVALENTIESLLSKSSPTHPSSDLRLPKIHEGFLDCSQE